MHWDEFERERRFRAAWEAVDIARSVSYSLFTFGETTLAYYLVCGESGQGTPVSITKGEVRVKRPTIITPDTDHPEFRGFFEDHEEEGLIEFILARAAHFSNLRLDNRSGERKIVSDSIEEAVDKLNKQLDADEEDHVAILTAPPKLGGLAVVRYASERILQSGPHNIQELRERGFLP